MGFSVTIILFSPNSLNIKGKTLKQYRTEKMV
jgi:hypothetical protein